MSESYKSGSVRGVRSNAHPYRDKGAPLEARRTPMQPFAALHGNSFTSSPGEN